MNMSAFKPCNPTYYEVINPFVLREDIVARSPYNGDSFCSSTPKPIKVKCKTTKREKKYWSPELKAIALEKAKVLGLSKATRTLQNEMPSIFGDLSPSTLQYWIQKEREQVKN